MSIDWMTFIGGGLYTIVIFLMGFQIGNIK